MEDVLVSLRRSFDRLPPCVKSFERKRRSSLALAEHLLHRPWEYVQAVTETRLHEYLAGSRSSIELIVVVGAYLGHEFPALLKNYPRASILAFEPSERYGKALEKRWGSNERVKVLRKAVAEKAGMRTFYETSMTGSGSVLEVGQLARDSYGMSAAEKFLVEAVTLDDVVHGPVSLLWIDTQGAEGLVVDGATRTLSKTDAVFIEVSVFPDLYAGAITLAELEAVLKESGFFLAQLGTDLNGTGNALFLREPSSR